MAKKKTTKKKVVRRKGGTTHVGFVLDESGSMYNDQRTTVSSFNEYLLTLQKQRDACQFSLLVFNTNHMKFIHEDVNLKKAKPLEASDYRPNACTPLFDAVNQMITQLEINVGRKKDAVLVTILTDGLENASETKAKDIQALIAKKEKAGWTFVYLGSNQDAWDFGTRNLGVSPMNTYTYGDSHRGETMSVVASATNYYRTGAGGQSVNCSNVMKTPEAAQLTRKMRDKGVAIPAGQAGFKTEKQKGRGRHKAR